MNSNKNSIKNSQYILKIIGDADFVKKNLADSLYHFHKLEFSRGNREGEDRIRQKLEVVNGEFEKYYEHVNYFDNAKVSDPVLFYEKIINFFESNVINESVLLFRLDDLKKELLLQDANDVEFNKKNQDRRYSRNPRNPHREELKHDITLFRKKFNDEVIKILYDFIYYVNILLIYEIIKKGLEDAVDKHDNTKITNSLMKFVSIYLNVKKVRLTKNEIIKLMNGLFQNFGFQNILFQRKVFTPFEFDKVINTIADTYKMVTPEIVDGNINEIINEANRLRLIRTDVLSIFESLCMINNEAYEKKYDSSNTQETERVFFNKEYASAHNLQKKKEDRFVFHQTGGNRKSLQDYCEILVDTLIFINDWLNRELKTERFVSYLMPVIDCIEHEWEFLTILRIAKKVSKKQTNRDKTVLNRTRSYITREHAGDLINAVVNCCIKIHEAVMFIEFDNSFAATPEGKIIYKKILIIKDNIKHLEQVQNGAGRLYNN